MRPVSDGEARDQATATARERFITGQDIGDASVRPEIARSWRRCRDDYGIDPGQTRAPDADDCCDHSLQTDQVLAELGSAGAVLAADAGDRNALVTVADGHGRVLATLGDRTARRHGDRTQLTPGAAWSESAFGSNGVGTALECLDGVMIRRSEHWCTGLQQWSSAGIAVRDPATNRPLAVLAVSSDWTSLPRQVLAWLRKAISGMERELRVQASRDAADLTAALESARNRPGTGQALVALDPGGTVVAASYLGEPRSPAPRLGRALDYPVLRELVQDGVTKARHDRSWVGFAEPFVPAVGDIVPLTMHPVVEHNRVIGVLGELGGEHPGVEPGQAATSGPDQRVLAIKGNRQIVLRPEQIVLAEAENSTVWLTTDRGRVRARDRGLDRLLAGLAGRGFIRVHRHFVVNARRVTEIEHGFRGQLSLVMDGGPRRRVPVSRRRGAAVRRALC